MNTPPMAMTAWFPNPMSACCEEITPVAVSTTGIESAVASKGIHLVTKRKIVAASTTTAIQA